MNKVLNLLEDLVSFESITPNGEMAINYIQDYLNDIGFVCEKLIFGGVCNLYAKFGDFEKNLCFAGHIDVVPPGEHWVTDPFKLTVSDGRAFGRGTNDMKGPLSSFLVAIRDFVLTSPPKGVSISVLITSDEEIMAGNGTKAVVEELLKRGEKISSCILCESCSKSEAGTYIKTGCKGSLNVDVSSVGKQCHVALGREIGNPISNLVKFLNYLVTTKLDNGNERFCPSNLEITSIDVGNDVRNIIPSKGVVKINIRFSDNWTLDSLEKYLLDKSKLYENIELSFIRCASPMICADEKFVDDLRKSIKKVVGSDIKIESGTYGGNSDALFLKDIATNVVEIGSPVENAHISNEYIFVKDLEKLYKIYKTILEDSCL